MRLLKCFSVLLLMNIVFLWQSLMEYEEHEKRAWSVDFSRTDPSMLVSGSDDCKVPECQTFIRKDFMPSF